MTPLERSARMAVQAMEEFLEAEAAMFPAAEEGQAAQTAWAERRFNAREGAFAALSSLREALDDSGWMPIETAPKDGTRVMLTVAGYKYPPGPFSPPDGDQEIIHLARYTGTFWEPYIPNDWTHWQPLPASPSMKESEGSAAPDPNRAPMTDGQIYTAWDGSGCPLSLEGFAAIVRCTEAHHGITASVSSAEARKE